MGREIVKSNHQHTHFLLVKNSWEAKIWRPQARGEVHLCHWLSEINPMKSRTNLKRIQNPNPIKWFETSSGVPHFKKHKIYARVNRDKNRNKWIKNDKTGMLSSLEENKLFSKIFPKPQNPKTPSEENTVWNTPKIYSFSFKN